MLDSNRPNISNSDMYNLLNSGLDLKSIAIYFKLLQIPMGVSIPYKEIMSELKIFSIEIDACLRKLESCNMIQIQNSATYKKMIFTDPTKWLNTSNKQYIYKLKLSAEQCILEWSAYCKENTGFRFDIKLLPGLFSIFKDNNIELNDFIKGKVRKLIYEKCSQTIKDNFEHDYDLLSLRYACPDRYDFDSKIDEFKIPQGTPKKYEPEAKSNRFPSLRERLNLDLEEWARTHS